MYIKINYGRYQVAVVLDCPGNSEEVILGFNFFNFLFRFTTDFILCNNLNWWINGWDVNLNTCEETYSGFCFLSNDSVTMHFERCPNE